jgi:hypothetical protein
MKIKTKNAVYDYKKDVMETVKIPKVLRDDVNKLFKEKKINKSKLIEEFYKTIILRFKEGSLAASNGYLTMNIFRKPITR